jgi:hypothetical protein
MRNLDFKDIEKFYTCYQEQIGSNMASNLDEQKIDEICDESINKINNVRIGIKDYLKSHEGEHGLQSTGFAPILTLLLDRNCLTEFLQITKEKVQLECHLGYFPQIDLDANPPHNLSTEQITNDKY